MEKYSINIDALEGGALMRAIWESRNRELLKSVFDQLIDIQKEIREEDGVQIEDHGGSITMIDKDGTTITRPKYEWE